MVYAVQYCSLFLGSAKYEVTFHFLQLEDEILTLRQVLNAKVRTSTELKKKLGITPLKEFQADVKQGFQNIKESDA